MSELADEKIIQQHESIVDGSAAPAQESNPPSEAVEEAVETPVAEAAPSLEDFKREYEEKLTKQTQEIQDLRTNLEMKSRQAPTPEEASPFKSMDRDDLVTAGQVMDLQQAQEQQYRYVIAELQAMVQFPDYKQVIQNLPNAIKEDPYREAYIKASSNPAVEAYKIAKTYEAISSKPAPAAPKTNDAARIAANAQKPRSINAAGGASGQSQADYYASMPEEELLKLFESSMG